MKQFQASNRSPRIASTQLAAAVASMSRLGVRTRPQARANNIILSSFSVIAAVIVLIIFDSASTNRRSSVNAFHLPFGHRLLRSREPHSNHMQLNPASTLIRPIECRNANNNSEAGICMFSIDCMQNKGTPLSICKHNYFVGTCCKLPDNNNFVGIVYDLRETEALQAAAQLAARLDLPPTTAELPVSNASDAEPVDSRQAANKSSSAAEALLLTTRVMHEDKAASSLASIVNKPSSTSAPASSAYPSGPEKSSIEQKYMISSTSLFPSQTTSTTTTMTTMTTTLSNTNRLSGQQSSESRGGPSGLKPFESARDADGSHGAPFNASAITGTDAPNKTLPIAYELIRDDLAPLQQLAATTTPNQSVEQQTVLSSAHSAFVAYTQPSDEQKVTIVFADNHRGPAWGTTTNGAQEMQSSLGSSVGSQEFALASVGDAPITGAIVASGSTGGPAALPSQSTSAVTSSDDSNSSSSVQHDLISSPLASQQALQTTTPFTSSLSTALLPNVSSHAFAPTSSPTPASQSATESGQQQATTSTTTTLVSQQQQVASSRQPSRAPVLFASTEHVKFAAQQQTAHLYSVQQASKPPAALFAAGMAPLHAASKIVAGSSVTANNLIPGLSGLQSAILSHIPFKIASGLSSGLSSYLQAAMKPSSGASRPLISSNTAPALQYQTAASNASSLATSTSTRTPPSTSTSTTSGHVSPANAAAAPVSALAHAPRDVLREAQQVCGRPQVAPLADFNKKRVARIVGGNQSLFGQWPWMVSLRQWRKGAFLHKCGAALLNENWAITAAHCVENVKAADLLLRLGEFDVSNQNEPFPYIERRVKTVLAHSSFDPKTFEYDLALLKFTEPIQYERNIIPVCVPNGNDSYVDRIATVIGWGRLYEDGPLPDIIQHVDVPIIANDECEKMYKNAGYVEEIPEMFICAGINKGGRDSCEGDSGGPLTMVDYDGRSYLLGIISWGIGCALPSQPGVYTRITAFSDWINQIVVA